MREGELVREGLKGKRKGENERGRERARQKERERERKEGEKREYGAIVMFSKAM